MYEKRALDLIDIMVPVLVRETDVWDLVLRLGRLRRTCASFNKTSGDRLVRVFSIRDLAQEIFVLSEEGSVVTEISRIDSILRQPVSYIARETPSLDPETQMPALVDVFYSLSIDCVPLTREDHVIGVVSENSLIEGGAHVLPTDLTVDEVATREVYYTDHEAPIAEVIGVMIQRGFRRMPVRGPGNRVVGIVTMLDVIYELAELFREHGELRSLDILARPVSETRALRQPIYIDPGSSIRDAVDLVLRSGVGCVISGREDDVRGIVTERDIIKVMRKYIYQNID